MFGGGFGGTGGFSGGYGGGGGFGGSDPFGGGGAEPGGFNAVPGGGGFGAAPGVQASQQGLGGWVNQQSQSPDGKQGQAREPPQSSMMPLTLKMLLEAHEKTKESIQQLGPDAPLYVNGRSIGSFTFVGIIETIKMEPSYRVFQVNDGTGRINVKTYHDAAQADAQQELQLGEYVRVFGSLRFWGGEYHVSAHHVAKMDNPNEISFHFIEVAHVHLGLAGRLQNKAAAPAGGVAQGAPAPAVQAQSSTAGFQQGGAAPAPAAFGGAGFGGAAVNHSAPVWGQAPPGGSGQPAAQPAAFGGASTAQSGMGFGGFGGTGAAGVQQPW